MTVFEKSVARALAILLVVALWPALLHADSTAGDYQVPDFDAELFDRDATSLQGRELADVMDALTAVVRNFESVANIDNDVKEKALAVALRLQPLNPAARAAHQLMSGGQGPSVGYESILSYSDTVKIFQVLAVQGERLLRERSQPDDEILGPLLMEIGLTILSSQEWQDPEVQKMAHVFHEVGGKGELDGFWKLTVRQQPIPGDGASLLASRLAKLEPLEEDQMEAPVDDAVAEGAVNPPAAGAVGGNLPDTSVMFLADVLGTGAASLADASLEMVDMDPVETGGGNGSEPELSVRLVKTGPENSALRGVAGSKAWVSRTFSRWPDGRQAVVSLSLGDADKVSVVDSPGDRWPVEVGLPVAMVMYSALSKTAIAGDVAISGRLEGSGAIQSVLPDSEVLREVGKNVERIAVLALPHDPAGDGGEALSPSEIEVLGRVQVIEVESFDQLRQVAVSSLRPPELVAAMDRFAEVQRVGVRPSNLSSPGLREKLQAVLQDWPGHYSAQRLLTASNADATMSTSAPLPARQTSESAIDQALAPLLERYAADRDPDLVTEVGGVDDLVASTRDRMRNLKPELPAAADGYYRLAVDLVVSLGDYLSLNNRGSDSANAEKHRQAIEQQLEQLNQLRQVADRR